MNSNIVVKSGIITSNEEWKGNVLISDDLLIPSGVQILIKPNTKVLFLQKSKNRLFNKYLKINYLIEKYNLNREQYRDKISIVVYGTIICEGSKQNLINIGNCSWNGLIYIASKGKLKFSYTRIRYSFGIISDIRAKVSRLDNCIIEQCCLGVASFSRISIKNCRLNYNEIGLICHKKSLLYNNKLIDNFLAGILFSVNNTTVYLHYECFLFNNIGIKILESSNAIILNKKISDVSINYNNIGILLSESINVNILSFKVIMYDNLINIYLNRLYTNINLNNLHISRGKGILIDCFCEISINNSYFFDLEYALSFHSYAQAYLDNIKFNNSITTFLLYCYCGIFVENSIIDNSHFVLISYGENYFYNKNNKFSNCNKGFILFGRTILEILNSSIDINTLVCLARNYSCAYFYDNNIKSFKVLSIISGHSKVFFNKSLTKSSAYSFVLKNGGKLLINDCFCKNNNNHFIVARNDSKVSINNSNIKTICSISSFLFEDNASLKIIKSNISTQDKIISSKHKASVFICDCKIKNRKNFFVSGKDNSNIKIINSYIRTKRGMILRNNVNTNISKSSIFAVFNFIDTGDNVELVLYDNKLKILNCEINIKDNSILYLDSEIFSKNIIIEKDRNNVLLFGSKKIVALNNVEINYRNERSIKFNNLILKSKNINIKAEDAEKIEIYNCYINSCMYIFGKKLIIIEKTKMSSIVIDRGINTLGINTLVLNDVVLKDCHINGTAHIEGSEIIGTIEVSDGNNIEIKDSEVKAKYIKVEEYGYLSLVNTKLNIEKSIKVFGKTSIFDSIVNSRHIGIEKKGLEKFVCYDTKIYSFDHCLDVSGKSNSFFKNIYLSSKTNYSVISNDSANLFFDALTLVSSKGFLCNYGTKCKINNLSADIFYNLINIQNTDFTINDLILHCKIPKSLFIIDTFSSITVNNANLYLCKGLIYKQYLNEEDFIIYLRGFSKLKFNHLSLKIYDINKMCFLRADDETNYILQNVSVIGVYKFIYMGILACGVIYDSKIFSNIYDFCLYQSSILSIANTKLSNINGFKFLMEDTSIVMLDKVSVLFGQLLLMNKFSQFYSFFSTFDSVNNIGKIKGYSIIKDNNSKWNINNLTKQYAFYLQNNSELFLNLSNISISGIFACCVEKSKINIEDTKIKSIGQDKVLHIKNNSKVKILNSTIHAYSLANLQNYAVVYIQKSLINVRGFIVSLIGNSKAVIKNTFFKQINNIDKNWAFSILHSSKINIIDSLISKFYIGIKYENRKNINIKKTKIDCKNKMIFTNEKRYLTDINPIKKSLLYRCQLFVLSTNKVIVLKEFYNIIYFASIWIYIIFCMCRKKIKSLYLRRGMLNKLIAGSSDIDYLTILDNSNFNIEFYDIYNIKKRYLKVKKIFPFYGENIILNQEELNFYLKYGGIRSKLLKNSKYLYGKKQNFIIQESINLKHKIDVLKEILNSYILLSNNYFYNIDIVSDICFSKASADILKYIDYFYNLNDLELSRIDYLKNNLNNLSDDVYKKLYIVLQESKRLTYMDRNNIFNYVFNKLNKISIDFNKEIMSSDKVKMLTIYKKDCIDLYTELIPFKENIKAIILDDPGLSYIVIDKKNTDYSNIMLSIYKKAKENYCFYNTPILFFTEGIFQTVLFSNFKNNPFECYSICNIEESNFTRKIYLSSNYNFYSYINNNIFKELVVSSLSEMTIYINETNILQSFDDIRQRLYYMFIQILQFYLFLKNDKITYRSYSNVVKDFKNNNKNRIKDVEKILFCFEEDCKLEDIEKIAKIIIFVKNLKNELMNLYGK